VKNIHVNYTAYEGVENLERFSEKTLIDYFNDKLTSCSKHISFIKNFFPNRKLKILEVGSGSGKLLFRLEQEKILEIGIGFELSSSRCSFANRFSNYLNSSLVHIYNEDFLTNKTITQKFDIIIGIDVVINLIGAININYIDIFFSLALKKLNKRGKIILESITLKREIDAIKKSENAIYYTWKRFLDSDPFKYGLDEMSLDTKKNLIWKKYFISRNNEKEEKFVNALMPISKKGMLLIAKKYSLEVEFYDNWQDNDDTSDQEFIAVFSKINH
jgi:SAM-dependent methyltransferase